MNDAFPSKHLHFQSRNFLPVRRIKKKDLVSTLFEQMREKSIVRRSKVHFLSIPVFDETLINIFVAIYSRCRFKERKKMVSEAPNKSFHEHRSSSKTIRGSWKHTVFLVIVALYWNAHSSNVWKFLKAGAFRQRLF